jgi:hypothetical protein
MRGYSHLKKAVDRTVWRAGFGISFGPVVRQTAKRMNGYTRYEKHFPPYRVWSRHSLLPGSSVSEDVCPDRGSTECAIHSWWTVNSRLLLSIPQDNRAHIILNTWLWQTLRVPGGGRSQILRQSAHDGGKFVSPTHRPPLTQEIFLVLISVRGWVYPRAIVRPEGLCQWRST